MGNWEKRQEEKKDLRERDRTRRENLAKYYLDLSKLTFGALVLGSISCIITGVDVNLWLLLGVFGGGIATTILLAKIGNQIFK